MKAKYPICITKDSDTCFLVHVPDLKIDTFGESLAKAKKMGWDAISATLLSYEDHKKKVTKPSTFDKIKNNKKFKNAMVFMIDIDTVAYRRKIEGKAVRRNITLPLWLDKIIRKKHLNVSEFLQNALIDTYDLNYA